MEHQSHQRRIVTGAYCDYQWLTSDAHTIGDVVKWCPEVALGHYLAVTFTDSGEPGWWAEKLAGWTCQDFACYSPLLETLDGIRYQIHGRNSAGFDEW